MNKVLVMRAAGYAARTVNSINKTMSFSFSPQKGGDNHLSFHSTAVFWEGVSAFLKDCLQCSPIQPGSSNHGSWTTLALCASKCVPYTCEDWGSIYDLNMVQEANTKIRMKYFHGSLSAVIFLEENKIKYVTLQLLLSFCFQLRTIAGEPAPINFVELLLKSLRKVSTGFSDMNHFQGKKSHKRALKKVEYQKLV